MIYKEYKYVDGDMFEQFIISGAAKLEKNVDEVNSLNVFPIPDGDTGDNMYRTIAGGIESMKSVTENSVTKKADALAEGMLFNARGNSGVILSQIFAGIAKGFNGVDVATVDDILSAINEGVKKAYSSVKPAVEGTILTVAREAVENIDRAAVDETIGELSAIFLRNMYTSLENTPELLHVLKEAGVIDSGGAGLYYIADGIADAINGNELETGLRKNGNATESVVDFSEFTEDSVFEYGYCTEFLLRLMNAKTDVANFDENVIIDYLKTIGDSIVAVKSGSIVKIHVHTMTPSKVLEFCQKFGEFLTVKIENMTLQHNETDKPKQKDVKTLPKVKRDRRKYASIVVCDGDGFKKLFVDLGVDVVIDGGQGKNPSINDFVQAFDEVNADNVFVFPNNSNIILAAEQAKKVYKGSKIFVLDTKNVGEAYSALAMLDYSYDDPKDVYDIFVENKDASTTVLICKATRDVTLNGIKVKTGEYIALIDKKIVVSNVDIKDTLAEVFEMNKKDIVTVFYGKAITSELKNDLSRYLNGNRGSIEVYEADGGQDTFDVIMIFE